MAGRTRRRPLVDLESVAAGVDVAIPPLDVQAMRLARALQDRLTKPRGSLGELEALSIRLAGMAGRLDPRLGARTLFVPSGDDRAAAALAAPFGVRGAPLLGEHAAPADRADALRLVEAGRRLVRVEGGRGLDVAVVGGGSAVAAATLLCAILGLDPADLGRDAEPHRTAVRAALDRRAARALDPIGALAAFGDAEIAELTGVVLEAAARRCPVLLGDGPSVAAAVVASAVAPGVPGYLVAACAPADPGPAAGLRWLDLRPLLDLGVRLAGGAEALLALPLLDASVRILNEMATFEAAGVSDIPRRQ